MDNFKNSFKYYKSKKPLPNFSYVCNLHNLHLSTEESKLCLKKSHHLPCELENKRLNLGIREPSEWNIYTFKNHPGLIIICNAFTNDGSMFWVKRCLQQFSESPYKTNLSNLGVYSQKDSWWSNIKGSLLRNETKKLTSQLRWATIGYHHNWDTKEYSEVDKSPVPIEVEILCQSLLCGVGLPYSNYKAEAGIVNYYPLGTTLSPHSDYSEPNKEAPLMSFSFGRSGIFLIGGSYKEMTPTPIYLHHGDVMIMSESARLSYHAVPRIMSDEDIDDKILGGELRPFLHHWKNVLKRFESDQCKCQGNKTNFNELVDYDHDDILSTLNYIKSFRINFNVRQVHG